MAMVHIPTEPVGSIPRSESLLQLLASGEDDPQLAILYDEAVKDVVRCFEATKSCVITDGEQRRQSFATYPLKGLSNLSESGIIITFEDGHTRKLPLLTQGPFAFSCYAVEDLKRTQQLTNCTVKQAVVSASMLSLLYPDGGLKGYTREEFLDDVVRECTKDIRLCLDEGALVQIDFTEGRLAVKLDPTLTLLRSFIEINNRVLANFNEEERYRIGVHTCPGGDLDSTHSADVDYLTLLPILFQLNVKNFYLQLSSESNRERVINYDKSKLISTGDRLN